MLRLPARALEQACGVHLSSARHFTHGEASCLFIRSFAGKTESSGGIFSRIGRRLEIVNVSFAVHYTQFGRCTPRWCLCSCLLYNVIHGFPYLCGDMPSLSTDCQCSCCSISGLSSEESDSDGSDASSSATPASGVLVPNTPEFRHREVSSSLQ